MQNSISEGITDYGKAAWPRETNLLLPAFVGVAEEALIHNAGLFSLGSIRNSCYGGGHHNPRYFRLGARLQDVQCPLHRRVYELGLQ
jgi:hypothetical protein